MSQNPEQQKPMPELGFQVFLSHRGPDAKNHIASLIHNQLTQFHQLRTFIDKKGIRAGHYIIDEIQKAIKSASVHVAIFSQGYAQSEWCLNELVSMLESTRPIIPVFLDVNVSDVRYIKGTYEQAFEYYKTKGRVSEVDMDKWKKALNTASQISGIEFKMKENDHGEILNKIVDAVLEALKCVSPDVAKVGNVSKVEDFPANRDELEVYKEFITEEFKLGKDEGGPDLCELFGTAKVGPDLTELFEADEGRPDLSELFEDWAL